MTEQVRRDIYTAVPVAFTRDGGLDLEGSRAILAYVAKAGTDAAFVLGTTGEFAALAAEERRQLLQVCVEELSNTTIVAHVGASSFYEVAELIGQVRQTSVTEIAVLTPFYMKSSEEALFHFFEQVSAITNGLNAYAYLFEARTGNVVSPALLARIAELPNFIGAKLSGESLESVAAYRAAVPAGFRLLTGADADMATAADFGAQGVVSGISSVFPKPFIALRAALDAGDQVAIDAAQEAVDDVVGTLIGDPARMKEALRQMGIPAGYARTALDEPTPAVIADIARAVALHA